jgi:hypothetical protein
MPLTNPIKQNLAWEDESGSDIQESESLLPCSEVPSLIPTLGHVYYFHIFTTCFFNACFNTTPPSISRSPNCLFTYRSPGNMYAFLISPVRSLFPILLISLDFIVLFVYREEDKLRNSSLCNCLRFPLKEKYSRLTALRHPNSFNTKDSVSQARKSVRKIRVFYVCVSLHSQRAEGKTQDSELNSSNHLRNFECSSLPDESLM